MQSGYPFKEALKRVRNPEKPKKPDPNKLPEPEKPRVVTPADDEVIKALTGKASKQNFDVNIRFIASAGNQARADQILDNLHGALVQFSAPDINGLKPVKTSGGMLKRLLYKFSFRLFNDQQTMVMSAEEIASLYHFPIASTAAPRVNFLKAKLAEPPSFGH